MLIYQNQDCELTLREGIEVYENYLVENNKIPLKDLKDSTLVRDHDASHVIFGLDTSLEAVSYTHLTLPTTAYV